MSKGTAADLISSRTPTRRGGTRGVGFRDFVFSRRLELGLLSVIPAGILVNPGTMGHRGVRIGLSCILVLAGIALRIWAGGSAGKHTRDSAILAPQLATGGPYGFVRNPIYLGTILIGFGMVGLIGDARLLPLCLATFVALYLTIIPAEEKFLRETFGAEYERYTAAVPRIRPRVSRWIGSRDLPFNWSIVRGEGQLALLLALVYGAMHLAAVAKHYISIAIS